MYVRRRPASTLPNEAVQDAKVDGAMAMTTTAGLVAAGRVGVVLAHTIHHTVLTIARHSVTTDDYSKYTWYTSVILNPNRSIRCW